MKARRLLPAAVLTLVATLAVVCPAAAAAENGATKVNQEYCTTSQFGTACFDLNYVVNTTTTPSGNTSFVTNGHNVIRNDPTFTDCTFVGETKFHDHYLLKDGVLHERGDHQESSLTRNCPGPGSQKCTFTRRAHMVDGEFQYLIEDFRCTPL